jgi:hypothetical protein
MYVEKNNSFRNIYTVDFYTKKVSNNQLLYTENYLKQTKNKFTLHPAQI